MVFGFGLYIPFGPEPLIKTCNIYISKMKIFKKETYKKLFIT